MNTSTDVPCSTENHPLSNLTFAFPLLSQTNQIISEDACQR